MAGPAALMALAAGRLDEEEPEAIDQAAAEEEAKRELEQRIGRLDALGMGLNRRRQDAINGRQASGIEEIWQEDEDAYDGIDDANRAYVHASARQRWRKPTSSSGTPSQIKSQPEGSIILPNITARYVDAAAARISDMLLPADEFPFELTPTPIPELVLASSAPPSELGPPGPNGEEISLADYAKAELEKAKKIAERAQKRIEDWLTETGFHGEARKMLDDAARIGTAVLKGPIPMRRKHAVWDQAQGKINVLDEIKPGTKRVDAWNCYPDPLCGENIHNGEFFFERDDITGKTLGSLKGTPGVMDFQVDRCLEEGPQKSNIDPNMRQEQLTTSVPYEIWYYHGTLDKDDLEAAGCDCSGYEGVNLPAVVTMVNDRVIRATINPLDNGSFPYDFLVWQPRKNLPYGVGVGRQIRDAQRGVTAASRALMDNAGLSAGPQIVVDREAVAPGNGQWTIRPLKVWYKTPGRDPALSQYAFQVFNIECRQEDLIAIIQFWLKMAEDITGMPMLLQGQQGSAPDTVGGMTILNNNASSVLRRIARLVDYRVIEPHVQRYFNWLLEYGEDAAEKGLFIVKARGSSVLVERDLQNQAILGFVQLAVQPAYGADPRKAYAEGLKAHKIDPERLQYTDEQWKTIQEQQAEQAQQQDPRVAIAQMNLQFQKWLNETKLAWETKQNDADRNNALLIASIDAELAQDELDARERESLTKLKGTLAAKAMDKAAAQSEMALKRDVGSGI